MKRRLAAFILASVSALLLMCPRAQAAEAEGDYIAANHAKSNGQPYYIMVDRAQSAVTVYGLDDEGYYTVPVKVMICSTGRQGHATPTGTFSIGGRWTWLHMFDGSYGQYSTQISGNILFHSVCYTKKDPSTLMTEEYNGLGAPASLGCVRLQTVDAKWIYDNCARGTKVTIYDGTEPSPLGKPARYIDCISPETANGWDPTDPREENPWRSIIEADQSVTYELMAQALCQMDGGDASDPLLWAAEQQILTETVDPSGLVTRQMLIAALYRYETACLGHDPRISGALAKFSDGHAVQSWAVDAMRWAIGARLIQGTSANTLRPNDLATKAQLDIILQRYSLLR